jgi:hypothetical protein
MVNYNRMRIPQNNKREYFHMNPAGMIESDLKSFYRQPAVVGQPSTCRYHGTERQLAAVGVVTLTRSGHATRASGLSWSFLAASSLLTGIGFVHCRLGLHLSIAGCRQNRNSSRVCRLGRSRPSDADLADLQQTDCMRRSMASAPSFSIISLMPRSACLDS